MIRQVRTYVLVLEMYIFPEQYNIDEYLKYMNKLPISVVVITKNEETKIRRCLSSVIDYVHEIIIIDDESTDNTPVISEQVFGAKVIVSKSNSNFDKQRNKGIEEATSPWILQMDADEEVPSYSWGKIQKAIEEYPDVSGFTIIRRDCVFGKPLKHVNGDIAIKLFKKDKAIYTGSKIHETLNISGPVHPINTDILHYNFDSIEEIISRWNHYTNVESTAFIRTHGPLPFKKLKKRLLYKTPKLFYKHYFKSGARKDGFHGMIWAILHTISPLLLWLKVLEKQLKNIEK